MVPFNYLNNDHTTMMANIFVDPDNYNQLIVRFHHKKLFNIKDITKVFGQVNFTYQNPTIINEQEFVNEFKIVEWHLNQNN